MNKSSMLSTLGAWVVLIVVISLSAILWLKSAPKAVVSTNPDLQPLKIDEISGDATKELDSLVKNGNLPVSVTGADLGRDNPFATY